jgi:predicted transcriptional regulator
MDVGCENMVLDVINDFEEFIDRLAMRKDELKDKLSAYNDPAFMKSIKTGLKEAEDGAVVKCEDAEEAKNLFESL